MKFHAYKAGHLNKTRIKGHPVPLLQLGKKSYDGKELKNMKRIWLVVLALSICFFMASNVFAAAPPLDHHHLYCTCLDPSDNTALTIERALCDESAIESGYLHGSLQPDNINPHFVGYPECDECDVGEPYDCSGLWGRPDNPPMPPFSPRVK